MQNAFPTLGAAVQYLNGFHHGKHLHRLNYLARFNSEWVTTVANNMWRTRDTEFAKDYPALLEFAIPDVYTRTLNGDV